VTVNGAAQQKGSIALVLVGAAAFLLL